MSKVVNVKGYGKAAFPDHFTPDQMRTALRKRFNPVGAVEAAGTIGSAIVAEPVSGLAGIAGTVLPGKEGQGADWVKSTQDALTYQPRTESGQNAIRSIGEKLAPIGEIIEGASKKLGDRAYAATESPALATAAYSAPTAFLEGLGLKGLSIAKAPAGSMNLSTARSGFGGVVDSDAVDSTEKISESYKKSGVQSSISERANEIVLNKVIVPKEARGSGVGTNFMKDLVRYAKAKGKTLTLTPSSDFGGNKARLVEFYKRFGFVENKGKNKDYEISEAMYLPKDSQ